MPLFLMMCWAATRNPNAATGPATGKSNNSNREVIGRLLQYALSAEVAKCN